VQDPHWPRNPSIPLPRLRTVWSLWTTAAVLSAAGVAALAVDLPVARWVQSGACPDWLEKLAALGETFGHGLGVAVIVLLIGVLDPAHRVAIPRIVAASLGSGLAANVLKLLVARVRPHHFDLHGDALDSFAGWLPALTNSSWQQGFPSSHTATAAGLAIVLASFYPRGRWLFPALAVLAGIQRVLELAHFPSDVLWGAAVGLIFAPLCVYGSRLSQSFDSLEQRLLAHGSDSGTAGATVPSHHSPLRASSPRDDVPHAA
jgi:membrane-associated phospholipid phosphatase